MAWNEIWHKSSIGYFIKSKPFKGGRVWGGVESKGLLFGAGFTRSAPQWDSLQDGNLHWLTWICVCVCMCVWGWDRGMIIYIRPTTNEIYTFVLRVRGAARERERERKKMKGRGGEINQKSYNCIHPWFKNKQK